MALYLGNNKLKININNGRYQLIIPPSQPTVNGILLLSYDNYILKDSNGLYLTA